MIKVLLMLGLAVIGLLALRNRGRVEYAAGKKLLLILFIGAFVISVVDPNLVSRLAKALNVGRGADLLLYTLTIVVIFLTLNTYLRLRDNRFRSDEMVRVFALSEARREHGFVTTFRPSVDGPE